MHMPPDRSRNGPRSHTKDPSATIASGIDTARAGTSRTEILGVPVDAVDRATAVDLTIERAMTGTPGAYVCLTNVYTIVQAPKIRGLSDACASAFLSVPDGMPLVWILKRRGRERVQKVTGIEHMPLLAQQGLPSGLKHFFLGGLPGVAEAAGAGLAQRVPGANIVGSYSPPMGDPATWDLSELRSQLAQVRPDIMWVGLGAPKQELWMANVAGSLDVPVMVGVGAAFDFLAGTKRAAPRFMSDIGLEWLFRLLSEPRRLWHRYLVGNSRFVWMLLRDRAQDGVRPR